MDPTDASSTHMNDPGAADQGDGSDHQTLDSEADIKAAVTSSARRLG